MPLSVEEKWENSVKDLLIRMQFSDPISSQTIKREFQVDISGGQDETYLVIDATVTPNPKDKYYPTESLKKKWFLSRRKKIIKHVNSLYKGKYKNFIWIVWIKGHVTESMSALARRTDTHLFRFEMYQGLKKRIQALDVLPHSEIQRQLLRYRLLKTLDVKMPQMIASELDGVPAIKFLYDKYNYRYAYAFAMKPDTLIKSCYVLKREEIGKPGYQRLLDEGRIKDIKDFIEKRGTSFPNNIIINYPEDKNDKEIRIVEKSCIPAKEEGIFDCVISLPKYYCSAQIIDGQHRLFAYDDVQDVRLKEELKLDVLAFNHLPDEESADIFIELNKEQKKIDPSLYWELVGDYIPKSPHGIVSCIVNRLNTERGVFHGRIDFPSKPNANAKIKLANFCKGLDDRRLIYGVYETKLTDSEKEKYSWNFFLRTNKKVKHAEDLAFKQINLFFKVIKQYRGFSEPWRAFVMTNTGLNVMLRVLVEILKYYHKKSRASAVTSRQYKDILKAMTKYVKKQSASDIQSHLKASSEGMRGDLARNIIGSINEAIPDFAKETIELEKERKLKARVARNKRKTAEKRKAFKTLIEYYKDNDDARLALRMAKRMQKEFHDSFSKRIIKGDLH